MIETFYVRWAIRGRGRHVPRRLSCHARERSLVRARAPSRSSLHVEGKDDGVCGDGGAYAGCGCASE